MSRPVPGIPTVARQGGVMGRPRRQPPADAAERIRALAADGWSVVGIAAQLGANKDTLRGWLSEYPALREAFDRGREQERRTLHNRLYRIAVEEDGRHAVLAAMFLLKTRHGYREGEREDGGARLNITFNLPGPMTREEFMRTVVAEEVPDAGRDL